MTPATAITFTKLFAQRSGACFATVLSECIGSTDLLKAYNRLHGTSLVFDEESGVLRGPSDRTEFRRELERFADFAWRDVFLQIHLRKSLA